MSLKDFAKTLEDMVAKTRVALGDQSGERYSTARVIYAVNIACLDFCINTQCLYDEINIKTTALEDEYDILSLVDADATKDRFGWVQRVGYDSDNYPAFKPMSIFESDFTNQPRTIYVGRQAFNIDFQSYGKILLISPLSVSGKALPSEEGNIQVTYVAFMRDALSSLDSDLPSAITPMYHKAIAEKAAACILEDGDLDDLAMAMQYDMNFELACSEAVADQYSSRTGYDDLKPM